MSDKKDTMLHVRISSTDLEKVRLYAEKIGLSQSEFVLNSVLAAIGEDLEKPVMENILTRLATLERVVYQSQVV